MTKRPTDEERPCINTDVIIWEETPGDYYSDSISAEINGAIIIKCGGDSITRSVGQWHQLALENANLEAENARLRDVLIVEGAYMKAASHYDPKAGAARLHEALEGKK